MWEFGRDGQLHFEKALYDFIPTLMQKWKAVGASHLVTVIMSSRTLYDRPASAWRGRSPALLPTQTDRFGACSYCAVTCVSALGRPYQDFYFVLGENMKDGLDEVLIKVKKAFHQYHTFVDWRPPIYAEAEPQHSADGVRHARDGLNSTAADGAPSLVYSVTDGAGNFLEMINLGLLMHDRRHIDRDLTTTGQHILVITAGAGVYEVDERLARLTKQRMIDIGIGAPSCASRPPSPSVRPRVHLQAATPRRAALHVIACAAAQGERRAL